MLEKPETNERVGVKLFPEGLRRSTQPLACNGPSCESRVLAALSPRSPRLSRLWRLPARLWTVCQSEHGSPMGLPLELLAGEAQPKWMDDGYSEATRNFSKGGNKDVS